MLLLAPVCRQLTSAMQQSANGTGDWVGFVALECVNVVTSTKCDATKCETHSVEQTELKDEHLKTNSGNTAITLRTRVAR